MHKDDFGGVAQQRKLFNIVYWYKWDKPKMCGQEPPAVQQDRLKSRRT